MRSPQTCSVILSDLKTHCNRCTQLQLYNISLPVDLKKRLAFVKERESQMCKAQREKI